MVKDLQSRKGNKKNAGKISLYSEYSQICKHALTSWGIEIFILLEPSDSCLHSHLILHATKKKGGKKLN